MNLSFVIDLIGYQLFGTTKNDSSARAEVTHHSMDREGN